MRRTVHVVLDGRERTVEVLRTLLPLAEAQRRFGDIGARSVDFIAFLVWWELREELGCPFDDAFLDRLSDLRVEDGSPFGVVADATAALQQ
jgi:L-fucose isomerase-like protein